MTLPTFVVVGAQKAGTTSLAAWLADHPDVFIPAEKEVSFFNDPARWWLGVDWYRSRFAGHSREAAVGDATPLMSNHLAVDNLARVLPAVRLIVLLRHPVERAYSHYQHMRAQGLERRTFEQALADERRDLDGARGRHPRDYLHRSRYLSQLAHLDRRFPPEAVRVALFDDLRDHPGEVYRDVCQFVGVDETVVVDGVGSVSDPRPGHRSTRLAAALGTRPVQRVIPPAAQRRVAGWNSGPSRPYPPLAESTRALLLAELASEVEALEARLGRDLSTWLR